MCRVCVYLYLFHYFGGTIVPGFSFFFFCLPELYLLLLPYAQTWVRAIYDFSFEMDIVFLVVTGKHDAVYFTQACHFCSFHSTSLTSE